MEEKEEWQGQEDMQSQIFQLMRGRVGSGMREDFTPRCLSRANIAVMMKRFFGLSQTNDGMLGQN